MTATSPRPLYLLDVQHSGYFGWGVWTREDYPERWIEQNVERMRRHPHYHMALNLGAQTYERNPSFAAKLRLWLRKYGRRLAICGGDYAQPTACIRTGEANLRHLLYGVEIVRKLLGYDVRVWTASEPGNFAQLPQILIDLGYTGALLKLHGPGQTGLTPTVEASKVYWIGPDGTRIPAVPEYPGDRFSRGRPDPKGPLPWSMWLMTRYRNAFAGQGDFQLADLLAWQRQYQARGIEYVVMTKDDDNNDQPGNNNYCMTSIDALARDTADDPRFQWVTPEEMMEIIPPPEEAHRPAPSPDYRPDPNLFETRGEVFNDYGFAGGADWVNDLEAEAWLQRADYLVALGHVLGLESTAPYEDRMERAWKQHLAAQNHDLALKNSINLENYLQHEAKRLSRDVVESAAADLGRRIDTTGGDRAIVVYNSLTWPRLEYVTVEVWCDEDVADVVVYDGAQQIPHEIVGRTGDYVEVGFYARVPALGYKVYTVRLLDRPASPTPTEGLGRVAPGYTVETRFYTARLAANGGFESLVERSTGRSVLGYRSGKLSADVDGKRVQSTGEVCVESGPLSTRVRCQGSVGHKLTFAATTLFYHDVPRIDTTVRLRAHQFDGTEGGIIAGREGRRLGVDYVLGLGEVPKLVRYQPFLAWPYDPSAPYFEPKFGAPFWVDFSADDAGVTFVNRGTVGYFYRPEDRELQNVLFTGRLSEVELTFGLVPHPGDWVRGEAQRRGLEFGYPLLARVEDAHPGVLPRELQMLEVGAGNVAPSSIFVRDGGLFLRVYEYEGLAGDLDLRLGPRLGKAARVDLSGNETGDAAGTIAPYQIATLRLYTS